MPVQARERGPRLELCAFLAGQQLRGVESDAGCLGLAQVERQAEALVATVAPNTDDTRSLQGLEILEGLERRIGPGAARSARLTKLGAQRDEHSDAVPFGQLGGRHGLLQGLAPAA